MAIWKPWDTSDESAGLVPAGPPSEAIPSDNGPSPFPPPTPTPSQPPTRAPIDPDSIACISATGWRAVTRDVTAGREARTWIAVSPGMADGPADRTIPSVRIVVGRLIAIGYCVPAALSDEPHSTRIWRIEPDEAGSPSPRPGRPAAATPLPIEPLEVLAPGAVGMADLFGPPANELRWRAGRYVFAVDLDRSGGPAWFSIEVVDSEPVPDPPPAASMPVR